MTTYLSTLMTAKRRMPAIWEGSETGAVKTYRGKPQMVATEPFGGRFKVPPLPLGQHELKSSPIADPNCLKQKCYLCGKALGKPRSGPSPTQLAKRNLPEASVDSRSKDHVLPKQFHSTRIRSENELNLLTLRVHPACNSFYQHDEDYFAYSIGQLVPKTFSGHPLLLDVGDRLQAGKQKLPFEKVRREWDRRPARVTAVGLMCIWQGGTQGSDEPAWSGPEALVGGGPRS